MPASNPAQIHLADYMPPAWLVESVHLTFDLSPNATRVRASIRFFPNPKRPGKHDLWLDCENLRLISAQIDGQILPGLAPTPTGLNLAAALLPDGPFDLQAEVEIAPAENTALEGLYMSQGMYCTQCEAEGFRKITFYPDRPDVMAPFHVRINADLPVLLSNGNPRASGPGWAEWHDPWPKPAYLFALVAGDLVALSDRFVTHSNRPVDLNIWVRAGDLDRCDFAMDALKRSMTWDETAYGREYDLDVFNIVAVDDFNMGAMENKGLNIFNSKYVLASPQTATDTDFELIEGIIAHEYFHNWTGNRITCRDWFQLCLKEGLTVFRDQQFSGDTRGHAVKRIDDVLTLRARQFREDQGPLAHPVRPESYSEINNFYTATVYEKGAEIIGMLKTLVSDDGYARALDLYFQRHDGDAATIEDWLAVFEDATGRNLGQFKRWYTKPGTPRLSVDETYQGTTFTLTFRQTKPPTPGTSKLHPHVIPIAVGLLNPNGDEVLPTTVLEMTQTQQSFSFENMPTRPVASILRGFSAPVVLARDISAKDQALLLAYDTDPFNKWEAGRALAKGALTKMIAQGHAPDPAFLAGMGAVLADPALDPGFRALVLRLPSEDDMAQTLCDAGHTPDPLAIFQSRRTLSLAVAQALHAPLAQIYDAMQVPGPYRPDANDAGKRALAQAALALLTRLDGGARASALYKSADNMTQQLGALAALLDIDAGQSELAAFYRQWAHDRLVIDKWFALQVSFAAPERTAKITETLTHHKDFDWKNPNRFRAVFGALAGNAAGFHDASGASYCLLADWLLRLDPLNPQTAARMSGAFETWARYYAGRQALIRAELARIKATTALSRDLAEMVGRMLR